MNLLSFEISNFRSIRHSGVVPVCKTTVLVGKNESGKSNVLYALERIKNAEGERMGLSIRDDYPVDAKADSINYDQDVIRLVFELTPEERSDLAQTWPRAGQSTTVNVIKQYEEAPGRDTILYIGINDLLDEERGSAPSIFRSEINSFKAALRKSPKRTPLAIQVDELASQLDENLAVDKWKTQALNLLTSIKSLANQQSIPLTEKLLQRLDDMREVAKHAADDAKQSAAARQLIAKRLPRFVYIDEYPDIPGRQSISEYLAKIESDNLDRSDEVFSDLLLVAGIDLKQLQDLAKTDVEERAHRLHTASTTLTQRIQDTWHDHKIRIRLAADNDTLRVLVADETLEYGAEINLEERNKGFQWFFGFIITVVAQRLRTSDESPSILLLDEAGLHLHPGAQRYLLSFLSALPNQTIYCTHLPFMIPYDDFSCVRAVQYDGTSKTTVEASLANDAAASILQSLLGYHMAQSF